MSFSEIIEQLNKTVKESTTSTDISYIPSHFGQVDHSIKVLFSEKPEWEVKILDKEEDKQVSFEDRLNIIVPLLHWEEFTKKYKITKPGKVRLIKENQEVENIREQLKSSLFSLLSIPEVEHLEDQFNLYRSFFGYTQHLQNRCAISHLQQEKDVLFLFTRLLKIYGEDTGALKQIIEAIQQKKRLDTFNGFNKYSFLYGVKVSSEYKKTRLYFEGVVGYDYVVMESIQLDSRDPNVLEKLLIELGASGEGYKVVKNIIYPIGDKFTKTFYKTLKQTIKEVTD